MNNKSPVRYSRTGTLYVIIQRNLGCIYFLNKDAKMSVIEGTWTTPRAVIPSGPMVLCTDGVIMCTGGAENAPGVAAYDIYGNEVEIPEIEFGEEFKNMPCQYANHINNGEEIYDMLTLDVNMEVMAILDAAIKSSESGKEEKISE